MTQCAKGATDSTVGQKWILQHFYKPDILTDAEPIGESTVLERVVLHVKILDTLLMRQMMTCYCCVLLQLFPMLRKWGATGLLVEYEDMFPYTGDLAELAAPNAYR